MPKVHPEFEDGYSKGYESGYQFGRESADCSAIKRDLAVKVLAAVDGERLHDEVDNQSDEGYMRAIEHVFAALMSMFTTEGVALRIEGYLQPPRRRKVK